jgi:Bacteriophage probable baseplate hub protein
VTNYFAPAFRIEVNGSRLAADISENIQDVQIVSKPDTLDTFSFTVVNALPDLRWTHTDDANLFKEGNAVSIVMGYVDDLQLMIEGEITQIKPTFPESGIPTVGIEGHTRLHRLQGDSKTRTFQKMTDKQIAEQIAQEAGLQADAEDTQIQHDYVMQPNQTDLQFLRDRASRINFEILVENKKLIFRKVKDSGNKVYTFAWAQLQKSFASTSTTLPLKSFSPQLDALQPVNKVEYRGYDPKTKQALVSHAEVSNQDSTMGGSKKGADVCSDAFQRERQYVNVDTPFVSQAEGDQHASSQFNQRAMGFVGGSAETIGIPDLRSGHLVELKGVGKRFEGLYYVDEATHSISESGYLTSFTVKRNSVT